MTVVLEIPLASMKHCRCQTRVVLQERGSQVDMWNVGSEDGSGFLLYWHLQHS